MSPPATTSFSIHRRRPFLLRTTSTLSLLLLLPLLALWIRSHTTADLLYHGAPTREFGLISTRGHLLLYREHALNTFRWPPPLGLNHATQPARDRIVDYTPPDTRTYTHLLGLGAFTGASPNADQHCLILHDAYLAALLLIQPLRHLRHRRRLASRPTLLCPTCHYDLRATPHRCPECGTNTAPPPASIISNATPSAPIT